MGRKLLMIARPDKRLVFSIVICVLIFGWLFLLQKNASTNSFTLGSGKLIRLHVLANSDSSSDQLLKLKVRDAVISHLKTRLNKAETIESAQQVIKESEKTIQHIAQDVIYTSGYKYPVDVAFGLHYFPVKSYGDLVLPAGQYEAVRILIGKAEGSNWWCVLFPPLCFVDITHATAVRPVQDNIQTDYSKQNIKFKWKIAEFWNRTKD